MQKRVAVTGIGPVTSIGTGRELFLCNLLNGNVPVNKIPDSFTRRHKFKSRHYVAFPKFTFEEYGITTFYNSILQNEDRLAVLGAKLALEDARIKIENDNRVFITDRDDEVPVIIGVGMGSLDNVFSSYLAHLGLEHPEPVIKTGRFNRMIIPMVMPNSPAAWVSIFFQLKGAAHTVNASCASGTVAIGSAFKMIAEGRCTMAVSGGVESMGDRDGAVMRGFDALDALTIASDGIPRPFSKERSGFLFSEGGGTILVLEEMEHAIKRGAPIYAEISEYAENSDSFNIIQQDKNGIQICKLLEKLTTNLKIDYINGHGTGTLLNDETECFAVKKVFGELTEQPLLNSTKGIVGHTFGASGAIEAAVAVLSIKNSVVHANVTENPIDGVNLPLKNVHLPLNKVISVSYGFGGHNAGILFERFDG